MIEQYDKNARKKSYISPIDSKIIDSAIYYELGLLLYRREKIDESFKNFRLAYLTNKDSVSSLYYIGKIMYKKKRWKEGVYILEQILNLNDQIDEVWYMLGKCEFKIGNIDHAVKYFERACSINQQIPIYWMDLAEIYRNEDSLQDSLSVIKKGVCENSDNSNLYYRAAAYCLLLSRFHDFLMYLEYALLIDYDGYEDIVNFFSFDLAYQKFVYRYIRKFNFTSS